MVYILLPSEPATLSSHCYSHTNTGHHRQNSSYCNSAAASLPGATRSQTHLAIFSGKTKPLFQEKIVKNRSTFVSSDKL